MSGRSGPRRLDDRRQRRVLPRTIEVYRREARHFSEWAVSRGLNPQGADQWDDTLVEYKNECLEVLTPARFGTLIASVEFFFPRFKGKLAWARAVLAGWERCMERKHTVPLGKAPGKLIAVYLAAAGHARLALGLVLQCHTGLRPSEMLGLLTEHVSFPRQRGCSSGDVVLSLGLKQGTKSKRAQVAILRAAYADVFALLEQCVLLTPVGCQLFPYSLATYRAHLKAAGSALGLRVGWGPHSPRAGWATDARAEGVPFMETREQGRWVSDSSLRIYLDATSANAVLQHIQTAEHLDKLRWAVTGWVHYFGKNVLRAPYGSEDRQSLH